jgi:hypothetical protein
MSICPQLTLFIFFHVLLEVILEVGTLLISYPDCNLSHLAHSQELTHNAIENDVD